MNQQTQPNVHKVLQAMRELEAHPAVKAYQTLVASLVSDSGSGLVLHIQAAERQAARDGFSNTAIRLAHVRERLEQEIENR